MFDPISYALAKRNRAIGNISGAVVYSDTPPENKNIIWINSKGDLHYFDKNRNKWISLSYMLKKFAIIFE